MATVIRNNVKIRSANRRAVVTAKNSRMANDMCVEVRLSDRDRDTLLSTFKSTEPNLTLIAAAEKYKQQCA